MITVAMEVLIGYRDCAFHSGTACLLSACCWPDTAVELLIRWKNKQHVTVFWHFT